MPKGALGHPNTAICLLYSRQQNPDDMPPTMLFLISLLLGLEGGLERSHRQQHATNNPTGFVRCAYLPVPGMLQQYLR